MAMARDARAKKNNVINTIPLQWCLHNETPLQKAVGLFQSIPVIIDPNEIGTE